MSIARAGELEFSSPRKHNGFNAPRSALGKNPDEIASRLAPKMSPTGTDFTLSLFTDRPHNRWELLMLRWRMEVWPAAVAPFPARDRGFQVAALIS
jgi:hypothetical protein